MIRFSSLRQRLLDATSGITACERRKSSVTHRIKPYLRNGPWTEPSAPGFRVGSMGLPNARFYLSLPSASPKAYDESIEYLLANTISDAGQETPRRTIVQPLRARSLNMRMFRIRLYLINRLLRYNVQVIQHYKADLQVRYRQISNPELCSLKNMQIKLLCS